jgi:transcriptional regulator with XRE-family HTH domain
MTTEFDMDDDRADTAAMITAVGAEIKRERKALDLSLEQLAQQAGVSIGLISGLERGRGNPSFNALVQVAHALNLPVARLFNTAGEPNPVVRVHERRSLDFHHGGPTDAQHQLLTPSLDRTLEATFVSAPPGYDTSATPFTHVGEEFGIVLTGHHQIFLDGKQYDLGPGDSITYPSTTPHWYRNPGPETVTAIWVVTPPTF